MDAEATAEVPDVVAEVPEADVADASEADVADAPEADVADSEPAEEASETVAEASEPVAPSVFYHPMDTNSE